jgi:RimJ/RimL family protein N-acetyltransferase
MFTRETHKTLEPRPAPGTLLARGQRTLVREFERADVDRWLAWPRHRDPLFESYNPPLLTPRQRDNYYQQYRDSRTTRQYAVTDQRGDFVGRISIRDIDWRLGVAVLGISFHPGRLDQGFGTDALWAFLSYYFGVLKMSALFLDVAAFNARAQRCYEKCGFRRCGQRWGEAQTDYAGIFRNAQWESIRHFFQWDCGLVRPLLYDMVIRREEWQQLWQERRAAAAAR